MSKVEELIKKYCPEGVPFKPLGECVIKAENIKWKNDDRDFQYIDLTSVDRETHRIIECSTINRDNAPSRAQQIVLEGDILFGGTRPMLKRYCMVPKEYDGQICSTGFCVLRANESIILNSWIYHIISSTEFYAHVEKYQKGASYPAITDNEVKQFEIPVPPLEIQREIVCILDKFTVLSTELSLELSSELAARRKQYDYYGDMLFESIADDVNISTVGEMITSLKTGLNPRKNFTLNEPGACYPYITGKDIFDNQINVSDRTDLITEKALELINKRAHLEKGLLLFASTGTGTVGRMAIIEEYNNDWGMSETLYGIKVDESIILPHYLMYFLYSVTARNQFEPKITKGSVPHLKVKDLLDVKIPVPSIDEQRRIVDILSRFAKLSNEILEGLPAEIEARQKQYEYYRDKLLTFKKAV